MQVVLFTGGILWVKGSYEGRGKVIEFEVPVHELSPAGVSAFIPRVFTSKIGRCWVDSAGLCWYQPTGTSMGESLALGGHCSGQGPAQAELPRSGWPAYLSPRSVCIRDCIGATSLSSPPNCYLPLASLLYHQHD